MNVYDFDNTIYDGESIVDFYRFLLKKSPSLISMMPKMLWMLVKYKACRISRGELLRESEKNARRMFVKFPDADALVREFWDKNQHKIKKFYLGMQKSDDVVISANASFLLDEIAQRLGIGTVISSQIDLKTGKISSLCFRENKPQIFREYFPNAVINRFYTDSMNDKPMFALAERVFIVKGEKIKEFKNEV